MRFVETPVVTRRVVDLLPHESYRQLQLALLLRPELGALIPGGGGLRKVRWRVPGTGKSGGLRIIYYWVAADDTVFMLLVYTKSRQQDMTQAQLKTLRKMVEAWLR